MTEDRLSVDGSLRRILADGRDRHGEVRAGLGDPEQQGLIRIHGVPGGVEVETTLSGPHSGPATVLDVTIAARDLVLHTMGGGAFEADYPASAFSVTRRCIHPRLAATYPARLASIEFGSRNGLSSAETMPFFLLSGPDETEGIWVAVGWSGTWRARLTKLRDDAGHRLVITTLAGELEVPDGERVVLPTVVVGAYTGDGWAAVRRHLQAIRPRAHAGWAVYNSWFNEYADVSAARMSENIAVAARLGLDVVTLDGAWYETSTGEREDFHTIGFGTWEPDPRRFPDGLEPVARAARDAGIRFGLWCEIERAHPRSPVAVEHPDWTRSAADETLLLLDLGNPAAREWAIGCLDRLISRWSLGWLKLDMTTHDFAAYWTGDPLGELEHIRGLYTVLDEIRERHPDLVIEGCASGGGRIDRETVARSDTFWISDQTVSPEIVSDIVANARRLLPAQYCYLSVSPQLAEPPDRFPEAWLAGVMPGVLGIMDPVRSWPDSLRGQVAQWVARYHDIADLLDGEPTRVEQADGPLLGRWDALEVAGEHGALLFARRRSSTQESYVVRGARTWNVSIAEPEGVWIGVDRSAPDAPTIRSADGDDAVTSRKEDVSTAGARHP